MNQEIELDLESGSSRTSADALATQLEQLRVPLTRTAIALGVPSADLTDVVQDSIVAALRQAERFDPARGSVQPWVTTILVCHASNWRRSLGRRLRALARAPERDPQPEPRELIEVRMTVRKLLQSLSRRQRQVVALYEIAELDAESVAKILGISPAGVRSTARDARQRLNEVARS